jgi:hypothetical protein
MTVFRHTGPSSHMQTTFTIEVRAAAPTSVLVSMKSP